MSSDKPLHPQQFPVSFHQILQSPDGLYELGSPDTEARCKNLGRKFRRFRLSLRVFVAHPLALVEKTKHIRTRVRPSKDVPGLFQLSVRVSSDLGLRGDFVSSGSFESFD